MPGATRTPRLHFGLSTLSHACCVPRECRGNIEMPPGDQLMPPPPPCPQQPCSAAGGRGERAQHGCRDTAGSRLGLAWGSCHASGDGDTLGCRSLASWAVSEELGAPALPESGPRGGQDGSCTRGADAAGGGHGLALAASAGPRRLLRPNVGLPAVFARLGQPVTADGARVASRRCRGESGAQPPSAPPARGSRWLGGTQGQGTGREGERAAAGGLGGGSGGDGGFIACGKEAGGEESPEGQEEGWGLEVFVAGY